MRRGGWLLERYVGRTILVYLLLALFFLTGALLTQQASRLFETFQAGDAIGTTWLSILAALLPTLVSLTLPMALLLATLIGLSQLGSESELIALQAAGQGRGALVRPVLLLGCVAAGVAGYLNLVVVPQAARVLRETALRTAQYKLESPVEPHTFNKDLPPYVFYIREGDKATGTWRNVFIYQATAEGDRLITAGAGRLDFGGSGETGLPSELFLSDVWMLSEKRGEGGAASSWTADRGGQTRLAFPTARKAVLEKLASRPLELDELTWSELQAKAASSDEALERRTAAVLAQKKLALSFLPITLSLLGLSLGLRVRRGGRGVGLVWGLGALTAYYLLALAGEQMARKGTVNVVVGVWGAQFLAGLVSVLGLWQSERHFTGLVSGLWHKVGLSAGLKRLSSGRLWQHLPVAWQARLGLVQQHETETTEREAISPRTTRPANAPNAPRPSRYNTSRRSGAGPTYLDRQVLVSLVTVCALTLGTLLLLLLTFTLFELWRFITPTPGGYKLVGQYLLYLMPLFLVQTMGGAGLIATLATYALMARRSEAIVWWASGQSTYRLLAPALVAAMVLGLTAWGLQERLMPQANIKQDELRANIKGTPKISTAGSQWLAPLGTNTIYNYEYDETSETLRHLRIFTFVAGQPQLEQFTKAETGTWLTPYRLRLQQAERWDIKNGVMQKSVLPEVVLEVTCGAEAFQPSFRKATQLSAAELAQFISQAQLRGDELASWATALQFKYALPFNTMLLMLAGVPLALGFDRRRVLASLGAAILISLAFWLLTGLFQQLGTRGILPAVVAGWTPTLWCAGLFVYLLSRART